MELPVGVISQMWWNDARCRACEMPRCNVLCKMMVNCINDVWRGLKCGVIWYVSNVKMGCSARYGAI